MTGEDLEQGWVRGGTLRAETWETDWPEPTGDQRGPTKNWQKETKRDWWGASPRSQASDQPRMRTVGLLHEWAPSRKGPDQRRSDSLLLECFRLHKGR